MTLPAPPDEGAFALSDSERQTIFDTLIAPVELDAREVRQPQARYVGGQPGAGKSATQASIRAALEEQDGTASVLEINNDRMRVYHPRYSDLQIVDDQRASYYTNPDADAWVQMAISGSYAIRAHVLLESSLRRSQEVVATLESYRNAGFSTRLDLIVTLPIASRLSVAERYLGQVQVGAPGRYVIASTQDEAVLQLPSSIRRLCEAELLDAIQLYRRGQSFFARTRGPQLTPDIVMAAYDAEITRQANELDRPRLQQRIDACIGVADQNGRPECAADMRALRDQVLN